MWIFYLNLSFLKIVFFLPITFSMVSAYGYQPFVSKLYTPNTRIKQPISDNVLWNTQPPTVVKELPSPVPFHSRGQLRLPCGIDGIPRPKYQWYVSSKDITEMAMRPNDQTFDPALNGSEYTLTIDDKVTKKGYFKCTYYCSAQNSLGVLNSNKVIVEKVTRPTSMSIKYLYNPIFEGEKAVVQCHMSPDLGPLYRFKHWEVHLNYGETLYLNKTVGRYSVITSTRYPQLHIRNITSDDFHSTKVSCVFRSNIDDSDEVVNNQLKTIEKFTYPDNPHYSELTCLGEPITATVGSEIELPWCIAPRTVPVSWYKIDDSDSKREVKIGYSTNDHKFSIISGNLLIKNITKADAGKFVAKGSHIKRPEITFTLNVYNTPNIYISPKNIRKKLSESAEFICTATYSKAEFRWLHNGLMVASGYDDGNVEVFTKLNTSILRIKKVRLSVSGVYQCTASSLDEIRGLIEYKQISGTLLVSEVKPMLVKQSPRPEKGSSAAQIRLSKNSITIECIFAANPRPKIDWFQDSNKISITDIITMNLQQDLNSIYNFLSSITISYNKIGEYNEDLLKYAGEYQAVATNSLGSTSCNTFVLVDSDMDIRLPSNQTALAGADYLMACFFIGIEVPEFFWDRKKDNRKTWENLPINHRTHLIDKGHKLLIKDVVQTEDEGTYRCTIKYKEMTKMANTVLSVAYPPILQNLPSRHDSSQNQNHICTIRSTADKPWYAWWTFTKYNSTETIIIKPDVEYPMFKVLYNHRFNYNAPNLLPGVPQFLLNYPNSGVDININGRTYETGSFGKFICHAKNKIGFDEKVIEDNFLRLEFDIAPPSLSEVIVGGDLFLDCTAKESDLNPIVKWKLLSEDGMYVNINDLKKQHDDRIFQHDNGTLVMLKIKETDPSKLLCFIFPTKNSDKVQSKIAYIEIKVPARIVRLDKETFRVAGNPFNLSCHVIGHNQKISIIWYYRDHLIGEWKILHNSCIYSNENQCSNTYSSNSEKFTPINEIHNRTYHSVHLEFKGDMEYISGEYKCRAKNKYNMEADETRTRLTIISKPGIVIIEPSSREYNSTSILLDWKPPVNDGNRPIMRYILNYSEISMAPNSMDSRNVNPKTIRLNNTVRTIVIGKLRPFKKYKVEIAAENEVGVGEAATKDLMTQEAKPERGVNNLQASSIKSDEILVSWDDPDPGFQNGFINQYQMCYQILPMATDPKTIVALDKLDWPDNFVDTNQFRGVNCKNIERRTLVVSSLPQFTDFAIRVIAFNSKGASPSRYTKVRTLEDIPGAPPDKVICEGQHQAINLLWNPPGIQTINGVLIGYAVYFYQPNIYHDESSMKSMSVQGRTTVIIHGLEPDTSYSIQIMAANRKGLGPPSASVICKTKEAKPEAPEEVKAVKINETCIAVSWLHTLKPNGKILEYCVIFGINDLKPRCQAPIMSARYNMMIICDYTHFEVMSDIQVYARNQYFGASKNVLKFDDRSCIFSIGGTINVIEGSTVILQCQIAPGFDVTINWLKDGRRIHNGEYPNMKILKNFSLEITSIEKHGVHSYSCSSESCTDNIDYYLTVHESNDGLPRAPIIDDTTVTENSIFVRWKSQGTTNTAFPVTGFIISYENKYKDESKTVTLDARSRSFYLNNVTCASEFIIKLYSQNSRGKSKTGETKRLKTIGAVLHSPDSEGVLPKKNIDAKSLNFNLSTFETRNNCSATHFSIEIFLTSNGDNDFTTPVVNRNISIFELENKCCIKIGGLHPSTSYKYRINASNPAGLVSIFHTANTFDINGGLPVYSNQGGNNHGYGNQSWLLMIVLIIVMIFVFIIVVFGVLYMIRFKQSQNVPARSTEHNQNGIRNVEETGSIGSEPSPYAVYQPEAEPRNGQMWTQQLSQPSSTPLYNYTDHHYNQIGYDKFTGRPPFPVENRLESYRRANSAECLSSLGNASVAAIADLESPNNIDPHNTQEYFRAPFNHCNDNDEVFQNIRFPEFSTINRKRARVENEILNRHNEEERARLMENRGHQENINSSRYYDPRTVRIHQQQMPPRSNNDHSNYFQQRSMPEHEPIYHQHYRHPNNIMRIQSTSNHPPQSMLSNNPPSAAQIGGYGSYYASRGSNIPPFINPSGMRRDSGPPNNQYSSYIAGSSLSNYNPIQRVAPARPTMEPLESPDEGIYTDRVVVV